jgi:tRNA uridine 5-carbamoylmethylation protein Kti12
LNDKLVTQGKRLVLAIIPFGIPGSGKSTFLKTLTKVVGNLNWSIASVSSDGVRQELIDKMLKKDSSLTRDQAFDRTAKAAGAEFNKQLEKLVKSSDKAYSNVHVIFVDKNHPVNGIAKTRQLILQNLPQTGS